jgi:outer membrane lipoprotein carrier protein
MTIVFWCVIEKKMKKILALILLFPALAFAFSPSEMLQQKLANLKSITADFHQTITGEEGSVLQESSGKMAVLRPGKFRWETIEPMKQLIITDGKRVWLYEPDLQQVTIKALNQSLSETPILLLTKTNTDLNQQFNIKKTNENQFELTPKNKEELFNKITITFSGEQIKELTLKNALAQTTKIKFTNTKLNPKLFSTQFSFVPPKNTDIINE